MTRAMPHGMMTAVSTRNLGGFTGEGYDFGPKRRMALWQIVQHTVFRKWWCPPGVRVKILRRFGANVGEGCEIRRDVLIHLPWYFTMGDNCWIGDGVIIINPIPMVIGSNVCLSQQAVLVPGGHDPRSPTLEYNNGTMVVKDGAWVAMRAVVLRDVVLGEDCVVGANALVTRSVPDGGAVRSGERW